ncbi:MAG: alpha-L-fucosidase [Muribaculaceae bacterium]
MTKTLRLITKTVFAALFAATVICSAAKDRIQYANTIAITDGDSPAMIVEKAAHVVPTANQMSALENEFIAFVHFGPNTFTRMEWGTGNEDPRIFDLKTLDTDQWCRAMKSAGMKMVVFTAKHHDGFCLWQSRYTRHGIMSTGFRGGNGDVLKDLSASCRKYGLKLGIYLSPADLYQIENPEGLYGNLSKYTMREIPRQVPGRPFANKTKFHFSVDDYNEYFLNQLFELLTEYGEIHEVWFDGAHPKRKGGQQYNYKAWMELIHTLAPKAVVFGRGDVRWCGNESGGTRNTEWNVLPYVEHPDSMTRFPDMMAEDIGSREKLYEGKFLHYQQAETNTSIREGWFYRDEEHQRVRSADDVFDIYERSVGGNSTFLLNIPPNRDGNFSDADVAVLAEVGERISQTYGNNLLKDNAKGAKKVLDGNNRTFVEVKDGLVISMNNAVTFNRIVLQEPVAVHGERIEQHIVDAWIDGEWREVAHGTNVGYKRILRFPDVTSNKVRVRVIASRGTAALCNVSLHHYASRPPQLAITQNREGKVRISPKKQDFNWKLHKEDAAANLNVGYTIHYTTDGSQPSAASPAYGEPLTMQPCVLKAVAVLGEQTGAVTTQQICYAKSEMTLTTTAGEAEKHPITAAADANARSYWQSASAGVGATVTIDLGTKRTVKGFCYVPPTGVSQGLLAACRVRWSADGVTYHDAGEYTFGNIVNEPSARYHYLQQSVEARYLLIEATQLASGDAFNVGELGVF